MIHTVERIPCALRFPNTTGTRDAYGGITDYVFLESQLVRPVDYPSDVLTVFMHPVSSGTYLPIIGALAKAGHHVLVANSRYRGNDVALMSSSSGDGPDLTTCDLPAADALMLVAAHGSRHGTLTQSQSEGLYMHTEAYPGAL